MPIFSESGYIEYIYYKYLCFMYLIYQYLKMMIKFLYQVWSFSFIRSVFYELKKCYTSKYQFLFCILWKKIFYGTVFIVVLLCHIIVYSNIKKCKRLYLYFDRLNFVYIIAELFNALAENSFPFIYLLVYSCYALKQISSFSFYQCT